MAPNLIVGSDGGQNLPGTGGADLIYGFDPNGSQASTSSIAAVRVAAGLDQPLYVTAPPDDPNRLFVVEKTGRIKIIDISAADLGAYSVKTTPFLDLSTAIDTAGERGLLGLAFDPGFAHNGYFYVDLINTAGNTEIRRYQVSATDPDRADTASVQPVITITQSSASNHKAGWLAFGPDGDLYAATGDGGSTPANSQTLSNLLGKILRIDVHADGFPADSTRNYAVPADNPFVGTAGASPEIFALGLRNPWRDAFDRATGDLYIGDVGQGTWEEVNLGASGANYGWPSAEGPIGQMPPFVAPIYNYSHPGGASRSITGGYVYRGQSDFLQGQYFYGDFVNSFLATLRNSGGTWTSTDRTAQIIPNVGTISSPSSFGEDARGDLYVVDFNGEVFRLSPSGASADGADTIAAGGAADQVFAGAGADQVAGDAGNDILLGMDGDDTLGGGAGADRLDGGAGSDTLNGGDDADWLFGGALGDILNGDAGDDMLIGGTGADQLNGGAGVDTALFSGGRVDYDLHTFRRGDGTLQTHVIQGASATDGVDELTSVETLAFHDRGFVLAGAQFNHLANMAGTRFDDVVFQNQTSGQVYHARMIGGTFQGWSATTAPLGTDIDAIATGDTNPDAFGRAELFVQSQSSGAIFVASLDSGTTVWSAVGNNLGSTWKLRAAGDVNGDASVDLIVQNTGSGAIYFGDVRGGAFQGWNVVTPGMTSDWRVVGAADVNRDGFADVVAQQQSTGTTYFANMAGGAFSGWGVVTASVTADWQVKAVADVTGDGFADVIFQNLAGSGVAPGTTYFADMANGVLTRWGVVTTNVTGAWVVQGAADVDNDGFADLLFQNATNGTTYYANMGPAGFEGWGAVVSNISADWHVA